MSENCPTYKQKLEDWKTSLQRVEALKKQFLESGDLKLRDEFEKLKQDLEVNKKSFLDFAYEEIEVNDHRVRPRINFDVEQIAENLELDENTPWELIEVLSKIPYMTTYLTSIKQKYKDRIEHWKGDIKDYSREVSYSRLKTVGESLHAQNAETFSAESLETVGQNLYATNAKTFSADSLETVGGGLDAQSAETFSAKSLEVVRGSLNAQNATTFSAKSLETVRWNLDALNSTTFSAPKLEKVRKVYLTKQNFSEFWDEEGNFDWDRAYKEGRLVIDEKIRSKVEWL